ncbi:MAG TPA: hypothetical protein VK772_18260 [Puia sp.]|jgi:hypothetical protein|nr:hypothetical protein [Puia sp.]
MRHLFFILLIVLGFSFRLNAQAVENAGDYMTAISNAQVEMNQKYMAYVSASAHSRRAKKIEKLRGQALESINTAKFKTSDLPKYKGDNSLRQASIDYIQFCYRIFNEDYSKIVNMEEIAEQSVDQMQAFLLLEEKTSEKLQEANEDLSIAEKKFAAKYNVNLVNSKNELTEKMGLAGKVNSYTDKIYIIFFKCNWEDGQLFNALNAHKLNDAEQARNSLAGFAKEGLQELQTDSLKTFQGNPSLAAGCREALQFYNNMASNDIPKLTDFYLKQENFDKIKKTLEAKGSNRTKDDVDQYNKAVKDINASTNNFNSLNQALNTRRQEVVKNWEQAEKSFRDELIPYYK